MRSTRREFLTSTGLLVLGTTVGGGAVGLAACAISPPPTPTPTPKPQALALPWPYQELDPVAVAERAYKAYSEGGCMYGAFEGVFGELREKVGSPYTAFPAKMMVYGKAGTAGWGTLCGALNGSAAAIYLTQDSKTGDQLINELFTWYGQEGLPDYRPVSPKYEIKKSTAGSPLCHVSVTRWCEGSGFTALSPERAERCAWLTASVAKYNAELLNASAKGTFARTHALPAEVGACLQCHGKGGVRENVHASQHVSCTQCHFSLGTGHPKFQ